MEFLARYAPQKFIRGAYIINTFFFPTCGTKIRRFFETSYYVIVLRYFGVKIELLNQTGSSENFLEVHQSLNSNSIGELLSPKLRNMAKPAIDVALNNSSIDEMLAPKADRSQRESFQPLTSSSIEELISPKTSNLTQSEVDLPPLTSFVFAHKVTKTPTYTSSRYGHHTPFCRARSQCSCSSFYSQPLLHCASVLIYLHQF